VIAGLAVAAGAHPDLGPPATAYVLILAAFGPLAARLVQPLITAIAKRACPLCQAQVGHMGLKFLA
jgi:monovalent cation:H+ antiporter-2, CPA2 family